MDDSAQNEQLVVVGSLFTVVAILAGLAATFAVILLALGDYSFAAAAGILVGLLTLLGATDATLARRQARRGMGPYGIDGPFPVMAVDIRDPLGDLEPTGEHGEHVGGGS